MHLTVRFTACLLALGFSLGMVAPAQAAEDSFVVASVERSGHHFMPLSPVRDGVVRVDTGLKHAPLRSDMTAMRNGFMRLDRTSTRPLKTYSYAKTPRAETVATSPVVVRRGSTPSAATSEDAAITDLFGAPQNTNFRNVMAGGGALRHAWPVAATVKQKLSSLYGTRKDPFHGRPAFHGGIDIAAATGTPILASAEGTVSKVETGKGLGKYVAVQHRDGTESFYGHLSAQNVRVGQRVMQGQKVGELGSTGRSTGPHLDYRIKKNGQTFNPMTVLAAPRTVVASR